MHHLSLCALLIVLAALVECSGGGTDELQQTLFVKRSPDSTGITFANTLDDFLNYLYYYNGGGVAVGDINGDGRPDLHFTANEGPNALYLNRGDFRFEDVTDEAGVAGTADWTMGVTMADVNGDGRLDIYVSVVHGVGGLEGTNQLFINQETDENGVPRFEEQAADFGLDFQGYGTQAAFFDYDLDGDLDVYLLNHSIHDNRTPRSVEHRYERHPRAGDRLLENRDGSFVDVSEEAGIYGSRVGYGLGVSVSDFNMDGCPDIYVANDFHEDDYLYHNNCDGTFTERLRSSVGHTSFSSMGSDAADINNDGLPDLVVLDMLPDDETIRKTSDRPASRDSYKFYRRKGYYPQYGRNTLQLNQGNGRFSEIGYLAGIEATDWSWAPLFADLDNDGWKDLLVTNGIYRRPNDLDYLDYARGVSSERDQELIQRMPQVPTPNYAFRNDGTGLGFTDVSAAWGINQKGFSNGAAYADLDDDGDLDLVVNNIEAPASIYENRADTLANRRYLQVRLDGEGQNTFGLGAKLILSHDSQWQLQEQMPTRGFQSSVAPQLHFGLGATSRIDSLTVVWPDGSYQVRTDLAADQTVTLHQAEAHGQYRYATRAPADPLFTDVTDAVELDYRHEENAFDDFEREPLIAHKLSTEGPALAVGDVNGDGLDDLYAGGAKWQPGRLLIQQPDGRFEATNQALWKEDAKREDVDAVFFDADGDGDLDLYVVSGGNEFWGEAEALRDRLYLNDGAGRFERAEWALPDGMYVNGAAVAVGDYDGDGDVDLFVGSRVVARRYGEVPESYLLENDGMGRFTDVTDTIAPDLREVGMVTDATWTDADGDGALDLVVVGTWMPVTVFAQQNGRFVDRTAEAGLAETEGWWNVIKALDADDDGNTDFVVGNLGMNSSLRTDAEGPVRLYLGDFDGDGRTEPILTRYRNGTSYPVAGRDRLAEQLTFIEQKFPTYESFGASTIEEIVPESKLRSATVRKAVTFASAYVANMGDGTYSIHPLPRRAQFAPMYDVWSRDLDRDGHLYLVLGGNFYGVTPAQGHYDASFGAVLRGDGTGQWTALPPVEANLYLEGQIRTLRTLRTADGSLLLVAARNDAPLQLFRVAGSELSNSI